MEIEVESKVISCPASIFLQTFTVDRCKLDNYLGYPMDKNCLKLVKLGWFAALDNFIKKFSASNSSIEEKSYLIGHTMKSFNGSQSYQTMISSFFQIFVVKLECLYNKKILSLL
jgi:hypothetical protein